MRFTGQSAARHQSSRADCLRRRATLTGGMPRYALKIEYDGGPFNGWQRQSGQPSVQQAVEAALRRLEPARRGSAPPGAPTPASTPPPRSPIATWRRTGTRSACAEALNHHLKPAAGRGGRRRAGRRRLPRPLLGRRAALPVPPGQPPRPGHPRPRPGLAGAPGPRPRADAAGRPPPDRAARLHHLPLDPVPGGLAGEDARRAGDHRSIAYPGGAEFRFPCAPAASCTTRCARSSARWSGSAPAPGRPRMSPPPLRPATAPPAARFARRKASTSAASAIHKTPSPDPLSSSQEYLGGPGGRFSEGKDQFAATPRSRRRSESWKHIGTKPSPPHAPRHRGLAGRDAGLMVAFARHDPACHDPARCAHACHTPARHHMARRRGDGVLAFGRVEAPGAARGAISAVARPGRTVQAATRLTTAASAALISAIPPIASRGCSTPCRS